MYNQFAAFFFYNNRENGWMKLFSSFTSLTSIYKKKAAMLQALIHYIS